MFNSTWEWIRILGFLAYFYFTIAVIFGLLRKSNFVKSNKNLIYHIHQSAGWMGFITLIAHLLFLLIDNYQPYSIIEIIIPFTSDYKPLLSSLGTIAFYLFFLVIVTSDLWIQKMNRSVWKKIHFLVLPAWILSLLHGLFIGTDTGSIYVMIFYGVTANLTVFILILRMFDHEKRETRKQKVTN
ncbi:ferric reductase-like transmembrane domain-containing protein [Viridibacillus sp. YIM B01967]|uniref:Ferric reductase-like transmembrane domain-containing protein n=1 Tax=Viridibacillus soli TaxID=2798301 RepID=A0ABS1HD73_9BACL|nr:ferric reductase-like transmembrane domain-containing protein [Viridibacillus soli]MBK3497401.1 ferric reductase-like transmembrane domain-containing protein [Viridibacillus soli]